MPIDKMARQAENNKRTKGFTLVEIMLALAVLGVGLTALLAVRSRTLRSISGIERAAVAQSVAERILAEHLALAEAPPAGKEGWVEGQPGYAYRITAQERSLPPASRDEEQEREGGKTRLYEVTATITYDNRGRKRKFSLTTLWFDQPALRKTEEGQR